MNHHYTSVGIDKLSSNQQSKIRNGHATRVKLGNHHKIHVSKEQLKKLHAAHKKNRAVVLTMDPYQQTLHRGHGFFDVVKGIGKVVAPSLIDAGANMLKNTIAGSGLHKKHTKKATKKSTKHLFKKKIGKGGRGFIGDLSKDVIRAGVPILGDIIKKKIAGSGIRRKKHTKKATKKTKKIKGASLNAAGYGLGDDILSTLGHLF